MAREQKKGDDAVERLKAQIDKLSTVREFERRLVSTEMIYAYVIKRFVLKFPEEAKRWLETEEVTWPE